MRARCQGAIPSDASPGGAQCRPGPPDPGRAVLVVADRFYKVVPRQPVPERRQDARGEFELLRRCRGLAGVPEALELIEDGQRQILVLQRIPGRPLSALEIGWLDFARLVLGLIRLVWALARRGVRHNDLRPENVLVGPEGGVHLVDFDQASTGGLAECLLAGLGLPVGDAPVCNGLLAPLRERLQARLSQLKDAMRGAAQRGDAAEQQRLLRDYAGLRQEMRLQYQ